MSKSQLVYETSKLLVKHFRNLMDYGQGKPVGFHSRIFSHVLHPEKDFVHIGVSTSVDANTPTHPEHVVPCAVMIEEVRNLIGEGRLEDDEIACLLAKHWKIATITKDEAKRLDSELGLKQKMPHGWSFETGDTLARLKIAGISLRPCTDE